MTTGRELANAAMRRSEAMRYRGEPQELAARHAKLQEVSKTTLETLAVWVAEARRVLPSDKLDGASRARLGAMLLDACRYLAEQEAKALRDVNSARPI